MNTILFFCVVLNLLAYGNVNATSVTGVVNYNFPMSGGLTLTVFGSSFGTSDPSPSIFLAGATSVGCPTVKYVSATQLLCTLGTAQSTFSKLERLSSLGVEVANPGQFPNSLSSVITFDAPVMTFHQWLVGNTPHSGAAQVTLFGVNFAQADFSIAVRLGNSACASSAWISNTAVKCVTPDGDMINSRGKWPASVVVGAIVGTRAATFSYDAPVVSGFGRVMNSPTSGPTITLAGVNFARWDPTPTMALVDADGVQQTMTTSWTSYTSLLVESQLTTSKFKPTNVGAVLTVSAVVGTRRAVFTYDAAVVTSIAQSGNLVNSASVSVTISGLNFRYASSTPTAVLDESACGTTSWSSATTVACGASLGSTNAGSFSAGITVSALVGTSLSQEFSFDSPIVSNTFQTINYAPSGGTSVTISGLNFAQGACTPTLDLTSIPKVCSTTSWTSSTTLQCAMPAPMLSSTFMSLTIASVTGTVVGSYSTSPVQFTFDAPVVSFSVQNIAPISAVSVTISGVNFASHTSDMTPTMSIGLATNYGSGTSGFAACATSAYVSETSLRCNPPATYGGVGVSVVVSISAVVGTRMQYFTFDAPVVTGIQTGPNAFSYNMPTSDGATMTIMGYNFGQLDATATTSIDTVSSALPCSTSSWTSTSVVLCRAPASYGGKGRHLSVTVSAIVGTRAGGFSWDTPIVSAASTYNLPSTGPGTITVSGLNFGGLDPTPTSVLNDASRSLDDGPLCSTTAWSSASSVVCDGSTTATLPNPPHRLMVTVSTIVSTRSSWTLSYESPIVSTLAADGRNGPVSGGSTVTISGLNFGYKASTPTTGLDVGESCTTSSWTSSTTVACGGQGGGGGTTAVTQLTITSMVGTSFGGFTFDAPALSYVATRNFGTVDKLGITIRGMNFGKSDFDFTPSVRLGVTQCETAVWLSVTSVFCNKSVKGIGSKIRIGLTVADITGTLLEWFTFDAPVLTAFSPSNMAQQFYASTTLLGVNFGAEDASPSIIFGTALSGMCTTTSWSTSSTVQCYSNRPGQSAAAGLPMAQVVMATVVGTRSAIFTFDGPIPTQLSPPNAPASGGGGSTITIKGMNFGYVNLTPTVQASMQQALCSCSSWSSRTSIKCTGIPENIGAGRSWWLTVGAHVSTTRGAYTYDSPIVSGHGGVAAGNAVGSGGSIITIAGLNFGTISYSPTVRVIDTGTCQTTAWTSSTTLQCETPRGYGRNPRVSITLSALAGTSVDGIFTFDAPTVSYMATMNSPLCGGATISLSGFNFGGYGNNFEVATPTATLGATLCATTSWTHGTMVKCHGHTLGAQDTSSSSLRARITVAAQVGTSLPVFTFDAPVVTYSETINGPVAGGLSLTLQGLNYGAADLTPSIKIGEGKRLCQTSEWVSTTTVVCNPDYDTSGLRGRVYMTVSSIVGTANYIFSYDGPVITHLSDYNSPVTGSQGVTVHGHNFNPGVNLTPSVRVGPTLCATASWTSGTTVSCVSPFGQSDAAHVVITVAVKVGTQVRSFTYDSPSISHATPTNGPTTNGGTVTIAGLNFGNYAPTPTVAVVDRPCTTTSWSTPTTVQCSSVGSAKSYTGRAQHFILTLSGSVVGTSMNVFTFDAPTVSYITAFNVPTSGGSSSGNRAASVTINGLDFAGIDLSPSAVFGSTACQSQSWVSATAVTCQIHPGTGAAIHHSFTLGSMVGTMVHALTYDAPLVSFQTTTNLPTTSGGILTLRGLNFATDNLSAPSTTAAASTGLGQTACASTGWISPTAVTCIGPEGTGQGLGMTVTVNAVVGTRTGIQFSYDSPVLSHLATFNNPLTAGGTTTVSGSNFGTVNMTPSGALGSTVCGTTVWSTFSSVLCAVPKGYQGGFTLVSTISTIAGTTLSAFTYDAPVFSHPSTINAPTTAGASITLSGTDFGFVDWTVTAQFGSSLVCETTAWMTNTVLECVPPKSAGGSGVRTALTVGSFVGTTAAFFTYDSPVISHLPTINAPTFSGTTVTLEGVNFGHYDPTPTIQIGSGSGTKCGTSAWVTNTRVLCHMTGWGTGKRRAVILSLAGQSGTRTNAFSYDAAIITHLGKPHNNWLTNSPTSSGASITMIGVNFGNSDYSPTTRVGLSNCQTTSWTSGTVIKCLAPTSETFLSSGGIRQTHASVDLHTLIGTLSESFTYDSPVISHLNSPNGPGLGGVALSLNGLNFGVHNTSPTSKIGTSACSSSQWVSVSSVICLVQPGNGKTVRASVTVDGLVGSVQNLFTFDGPVITHAAPMNSATSGLGSITISGMNFNTQDYSPSIRIGSSTCGTTVWTTDSSVVCQSSAGAGADGLLSITISTLIGSVASLFSYDSPAISQTMAFNGPTSSGLSITLNGLNFASRSVTPSARLGVSSCGTAAWISTTSIICHHTSHGYGSGFNLVTTVSNLVGTALMAYTYDTPATTAIHPANHPGTTTSSITLNGVNFVFTDISPTVTVGQTVCETSQWISETAIKCKAPPGTGRSHNVLLTSLVETATAQAMFTYDSPVVSQAADVAGNPSGGFSVTLSGTNFGVTNLGPSAYVGQTLCTQSQWISHSSVICGGPPGFGSELSINLVLDQVSGSLHKTFTYAGPIVTNIAGFNSPTSGGASVTMSGENFGISDPTPTIVIGSTGAADTQRCLTSSWYSVTSVLCAATSDAGLTKTVRLNVGDNVGTATHKFTYDSPVVTLVKQPNGPTSGGVSVTLYGVNFGNFDFSLSSRVGATECGTVSWNTESMIVCQSNVYGDGGSTLMSVTIDSVQGTLMGQFSYDTPTVSFVAHVNTAGSAGTSLTVFGTSFSMANLTPTTRLGATMCGTTSWTTNTAARCEIPKGSGKDTTVNLINSGLTSTGLKLFTYDAPRVTFSQGYNGASTGGYSLTVLGTNFGVLDLTPSVKIGKTVCRTTTWNSLTSLMCGTAAGYGSRLHTTASVTRLAGTGGMSFTYDAPVVSMVSHKNMPSTSGASITIYGNQFGFEDTTPLPRVGVTRCATTSWNSETTLVCKTASGTGFSHSFALTVGVMVGTLNVQFSYDAPVLTFPHRPNAPATGSASLTLYGMNFATGDLTLTGAIGRTNCVTSSWISSTSLTCVSPVSSSIPVDASVTRDLIGTALHVFTYDSPIVSILSLPNGAASGSSSITLVGSNFVSVNLTPSATVGESVCTTTQWTTSSMVKCQLRPGLDTFKSVVLTMASLVGTSFKSFTYDTPSLTYTYRFNVPLTHAQSITINGMNLGTFDDYSPTIKLGDTYCTTTSWVATTALKCMGVTGTGIGVDLAISLGSVVGTGLNLFSYDSPVISIVERNNCPGTAGTTVTMAGSNFGVSDSLGQTAIIGLSSCQQTSYISATSLTCAVPQGAGSYIQAGVEVTSNIGTMAAVFSYDAPIVTFVDRYNAPATGAAEITINGFNFGSEDFTPTSVMGSSSCSTTQWLSLTAVTCASGIGQGTALLTGIFVDSTAGTLVSAFSYDAPIISTAEAINAPTTSGVSVTVTGLNFLPTDYTPTSYLGDAACSTTSWTSASGVSCFSPGHGGQNVAVGHLVSGNMGYNSGYYPSNSNMFSFDSPIFSRTALENTASSADNLVTIQGLNFGSSDVTPTVFIGVTSCQTTIWSTETSVTCDASAGTGARSLTASIHSLIGTGFMAFTYDTAVISYAGPGNSASSGGAMTTISGMNFGSMDNSVTVHLGTLACSTVTWTTNSGVVCQAAAGNGHQLHTTVLIDISGTTAAVFTYDSPVTSVVSVANSATSGAGVVTMLGRNFGVSDRTPTQQLGVTSCSTTIWSTDTSVACTVATGTGAQLQVVAQVSSVAGTMFIGFSYDSPAVTFISGSNSPATGGVATVVNGMNFGTAYHDSTPSVFLGKTLCSTSSWSSQTAVSCQTSPGGGAALNVGLMVDLQVGSMPTSFTYDSPVVTHGLSVTSHVNSPASGAASVSLLGINFGLANSTPSLRLGTTQCATSVWVSNSAVSCIAASGSGAQHTTALTVEGVTGTQYIAFTYDSPAVTFVSASNSPSTGRASVTLSGANFGVSKINPVSQQFVRLGESVCSSNYWISDTSIVCSSSFGAGHALNANVVLSSVAGTGVSAFTYDSPVVTYATRPNAATSGGASLTIRGQNFGAANYSPTILIGASACATTHWRADSMLVCKVSPGIFHSLHLAVTLDGVVGTDAAMFTYDAPLVTQTEAKNAPAIGGATITVYGTNLGNNEGLLEVSIGATPCATAIWSAQSAIKCTSPAGTGLTKAATVTVGGLKGDLQSKFTFDGPIITFTRMSSSAASFVYTNGPTAQTYTMTMSGTNFGAAANAQSAMFGSKACDTTQWISDTALHCGLQGGSGLGKLAVIVDSVVGTTVGGFTFDGPVITNMKGVSNIAATGGGSLTLSGFNFGDNDFTAEARIGSTTCTTVSWISATELVCLASPGVGTERSVQVSVSEVVGTGLKLFSYNAPVPTHTTVTNIPTKGGGFVTIHGFNFGASDASGIGAIGAACDSTTWASDTSVACLASAGSGSQSVSMSVAGNVGCLVMSFTYDAPTITRLHVPNVPSTSGATVTLMGTNFGPTESCATVKIGGTTCETTFWASDTQMVCAAKTGMGDKKGVSLEVTSLIGTYFLAFSYDSPIVTQAAPLNLPVSAGASVTVSGTNFGAQDSAFQVAIGATTCLASTYVTTTSLKCNPAPGAGVSVPAYVIGSGNPAKSYEFSYDGPVITDVVGKILNGPTSGGNSLTLSGMNFGVSEFNPATYQILENPRAAVVAVSECQQTSWVSDSAVTCLVPEGIGTMRHIALVYERNVGTLAAAFCYDAPVVTHLKVPNAPTAGNALMTINGMNLGSPNPYAGNDVLASMNPAYDFLASMYPTNTTRAYIENSVREPMLEKLGVTYKPCITTSFISTTEIVCTTPSGSGAGRGVQVQVEGAQVLHKGKVSTWLAGELKGQFSYDSPILTHLVPSNAPIASGATLTMFGTNFGLSMSGPALHLGAETSTLMSGKVQFVSDSSMIAEQPPYQEKSESTLGSGISKDLTLILDGPAKAQKISTTFKSVFSFDAPVVLKVVPPNVPTGAGTQVTVEGMNFGLGKSKVTALIGGTTCANTNWISTSLVTCDPAQGIGNMKAVTVNLADNVGTLHDSFTYDAPVIEGITVLAGGDSVGDTEIEIIGRNFGPKPDPKAGTGKRRSGLPPVLTPGTPLVRIGDEYCRTSVFATANSIKCTSIVRADPTLSQLVSVTLDGNTGTTSYPFQYGVTCPNNCYSIEGRGSCTNGVCRCNNVPNTERVYEGADCSLEYCKSVETLTAPAGSITDHTEKTYFYKPWYRAGPDEKCAWVINPDGNGKAGGIKLSVQKVDINPSDRLMVRDGKDSSAPVLAILTGAQGAVNNEIRSTGGTLFVTLETLTSGGTVLRDGFTGFSATYVSYPAICPLDCSSHLGLGKCDKPAGKCVCEDGWRGEGCNIGYPALDEDGAELDDENWEDQRGLVFEREATLTFGCASRTASVDRRASKTHFWFATKGQRYIKSNALNFAHGGYVSFYIKLGTGETACEKVDPGEEVELQYSSDISFADASKTVVLGKYSPDGFENFRLIEVQVPKTKDSIYLRWIQPKHDMVRYMDTWALQEIKVVTPYVCPKDQDGTSCSGRGVCIGTDQCSCYEGFIGGNCGAACYWNYWHEKECGCPVPLEGISG